MQASEARQAGGQSAGASPGPKGHPISYPSSETEEEDEEHLVTDEETGEARAAEVAAALKFGGPDHPEPLYMPGDTCPQSADVQLAGS